MADSPLQAATTLTAPEPGDGQPSVAASPKAPPNPENPPPQDQATNSLNGFFGQAGAPEATPQQTPAIKAPTIPPVPTPAPGAYSPEQEQEALRIAQATSNPEERIKLLSAIKRDYANLAMMDGITQKAREEALKKAVSQYSTAVKQIQDDPQASWQQKQLVAKKLLETMWKDPRTDYGETREQLEAHMLGMAGIQNTRGLGTSYTEMFSAVANKEITDPRQIIQMEAQGQLTSAGAQKGLAALGAMGKPDHEVVVHQQALALQAIKQEVLKDTDESIPGMKPSDKQYRKLFDVQSAFLAEVAAAGTDHDKIMKISSPEAVRDLVDRVYPWDQRNIDYMSRGATISIGGIPIPATVPSDTRSQTAYRNIVALPPTIPDKDGKPKAVPQQNWQQAIEILRETGNVAAFEHHFPGQNGMRILKTIPYVKPPPGSNPPVVQPAEVPAGFWPSISPPTLEAPSTMLNKAIDTSIGGLASGSTVAADKVSTALRASLPALGIPSRAMNATIDAVISAIAGASGPEAKKSQAEAKK
jgi:hypothetical protein